MAASEDHMPREISDEEIAAAALEILDQRSGEFIKLATLGPQISKKFGETPLRVLLGTRRLSKILREHLRDQAEFQEQDTTILVRSKGPRSTSDQLFRYDPAIWAAFAKPIPESRTRWVHVKKPFRFDDFAQDETVPPDRIQVHPQSIPDEKMDHLSRQTAVRANIESWSESNKIDAKAFLLPMRPKKSSSATSPASGSGVRSDSRLSSKLNGASALIDLVNAIPPEERWQFSLPLNLIGRLLS